MKKNNKPDELLLSCMGCGERIRRAATATIEDPFTGEKFHVCDSDDLECIVCGSKRFRYLR